MSLNTSDEFAYGSTFSSDAARSYRILQRRLETAQNRPRRGDHEPSYVVIERCERALNAILRHPDRTGLPGKMAKAAYCDAGKVVNSRRVHHVDIPYTSDPRDSDWSDQCTLDSLPDPRGAEFAAVDLRYDLSLLRLSPRDDCILDALMAGYDATDIAALLGIPVRRVSVWITRVRARVRRHLAPSTQS